MNKLDEFLKAFNDYSIQAGIHIVKPNIEELKIKIREGDLFLAYSVDTIFLNFISKSPINDL